MKAKHNGGFSLIEVLIAMVILAMIVVPTCTALVMSTKINAKTEALTQAQLAVSSAVETLMAKGYSQAIIEECQEKYHVVIELIDDAELQDLPCYKINVSYTEPEESDPIVLVTTIVRKTLEAATVPTETQEVENE